ncbi:nucleotide-binding alpha-beta plait domain-containing protein [Artemisia annua]|uniref:Nucleotide-binding alpha-beta plait domain-containing protein n=1 Tax=Artemisia annua TaxID=35608 RepID=A0A2U1KQP0_ARTAN|nr:nucleotide-binding alpha-beta plait domain-containing protein [Artemisia annua]
MNGKENIKFQFEKFGRITDVVMMHDKVTHCPQGFGFINRSHIVPGMTFFQAMRQSQDTLVILTGCYPVNGYGLGPVSPRIPWGPLPMPVYPAYKNDTSLC